MQYNQKIVIFGIKRLYHMKQLILKDAELMNIAIMQEIHRSDESKYDHRLHGLLLISNGYDSYKVAEMFGQNATSVQRWVKKFNESGFSGLREGERVGRPNSLSNKQWDQLGKDLRKTPAQFQFSQSLWDGKLLSIHINRQYGIDIGVRQCQRIFSRMGFRLRKPRPIIAHANPEAQRALKKTKEVGKKGKV